MNIQLGLDQGLIVKETFSQKESFLNEGEVFIVTRLYGRWSAVKLNNKRVEWDEVLVHISQR